jgi:pseudouridine synthase
MSETMRLQKLLADRGVASRRHAEEMIRAGRIKVNGEIVSLMGMQVSGSDVIEVDGKPLPPESNLIYLMLNKPAGYITSVGDPQGRQTVMELLKDVRERVFPVGRLDADTEGLLLFTNDGDFSYALMHPRFHVPREYEAVVAGRLTPHSIERLKQGVPLPPEGELSGPIEAVVLEQGPDYTRVKVTLHEGKKREVKRAMVSVGNPVQSLKRTTLGSLKLGGLSVGSYRYLTAQELERLRRDVSLAIKGEGQNQGRRDGKHA